MHWTSFKNEGTLKAMACSVRRRRNLRVRDVNYRTGRVDQTDGQKTQDLQTSLGFFDLAIAAPSMKAALERGAKTAISHQGAAKESHDPGSIAATTAQPGVVLTRPVGSDRHFSELAELPTNLGGGGSTKAKSKGPRAKKPSSRPVDEAAERKAALAYERAQKRRDVERAREEAARQKERECRQRCAQVFLTQLCPRPLAYTLSRTFDTTPSRPNSQACANISRPSISKLSLNWTVGGGDDPGQFGLALEERQFSNVPAVQVEQRSIRSWSKCP
jgi:hypothetical protein